MNEEERFAYLTFLAASLQGRLANPGCSYEHLAKQSIEADAKALLELWQKQCQPSAARVK